jgi:hypothetical protein
MRILSDYRGAIRIGCLAGLLLAQSARAIPPIVSHVSDPAQLVAAQRLGVTDLEAKLADFETRTGIRILVEFHAKSPSPAEDEVPGAYMKARSARLGTLEHGVLLVYFADDPDWRIWIGNDLAARFAGKSGTVEELTASKAIHDVKEALLASAKAKADAAAAALGKPSGGQRLILDADALAEALMIRLQPK